MKKDKENNNTQISFYTDEEQKNRFDQALKDNCQDKSKVLRRLLELYTEGKINIKTDTKKKKKGGKKK